MMIIILGFFCFTVSAQYLEIGFVTDIGGFGDNNYNDQILSSLKKAEKNLNLKIEYQESELMTEYLNNLNHLAENKMDLIWGVGFTMEQAVKEAAQLYPERNFVIFDAVVEEENVLSIDFKEKEEAFLAGVIAALESNSFKVAFIGGRKNSKILNYQRGFRAGLRAVNPKIEVINKYIGSFNDYSKAKKISSALISEKVDIIFYAAGPASRGIIDTAIENDIKLISVDPMDKRLAPKNLITIILKNTEKIVLEIVEDLYNDNYVNEIREYGIAENAFIIDQDQAETMMSINAINKIEEYKKQLITGEVEINN